jgi:GNAT superfamily N-acetyltransferase
MSKELKFQVRRCNEEDHEWICGYLAKEWGSSIIVTRGVIHKADILPGFIAESEGERRGLLTYNLKNTDCEIISLNSDIEKQGIGSALINVLKVELLKTGCRRLWLITTNDNTNAIEFYKRRGFRIATIHRNAIEESRKLKPEIPLTGMNGIPIKDEIEMELVL